MVQPIDLNLMAMKPVYNAVNIKIRKPEVNANSGQDNGMSCITDNGIYNAVKIDIDKPAINKEPKKIYDYPQAQGVVTYDMAGLRPVEIPAIEYHSATLVLPEETKEEPVVPAPNYTTLEAEKELAASENAGEKKNNNVAFHGLSFKANDDTEIKRPEIVPGVEIKPEVNIADVVAKLSDSDLDAQAIQMEEIARKALENKDNAIPYIVKDVFNNLIDITRKDSTKLEAPTEEQMAARQKLIANFITIQQNPQIKDVPFKLSEEEIALATKITPMEQAERNKEYALYTIAVLAKIYVDEIQKETGNVVPMTDVPGMSAIVSSLRNSQNSGVKIAALDALRYQQRDEYKEELSTLYSIEQNDKNPQVALAAKSILAKK